MKKKLSSLFLVFNMVILSGVHANLRHYKFKPLPIKFSSNNVKLYGFNLFKYKGNSIYEGFSENKAHGFGHDSILHFYDILNFAFTSSLSDAYTEETIYVIKFLPADNYTSKFINCIIVIEVGSVKFISVDFNDGYKNVSEELDFKSFLDTAPKLWQGPTVIGRFENTHYFVLERSSSK